MFHEINRRAASRLALAPALAMAGAAAIYSPPDSGLVLRLGREESLSMVWKNRALQNP
jgi:hypothetical protein